YAADIDLANYQSIAQNTLLTTPLPTLNCTGPALAPSGCTATAPTTCAYFDLSTLPIGSFACFGSGTAFNPTLPGGAVIYINGDAQFQSIAIDLKGDTSTSIFRSTGAII